MKRGLAVAVLVFNFLQLSYGQLSLYNTRTLYDSFENPAQKAFQVDSSRKYAANFLFPHLSLDVVFSGPAQMAFKSLLFSDENNPGIKLIDSELNRFHFQSNTYIAMFRTFNRVKANRETGFSWQLRAQGSPSITNSSFALFNDYKIFKQPQYLNVFNNSGGGSMYHQFSFTFREDFNRRLGLGFKLSYLSGIAYTNFDINQSSISLNSSTKMYTLHLGGNVQTTTKFADIDSKIMYPGFKNPGFSLSLGSKHTFNHGFSLLANIKDLGFIRWGKILKFQNTIQFKNDIKQDSLKSILKKNIFSDNESQAKTTRINSRAELVLSKNLDQYQPSVLLSKNIFNPGGEIAFINTYRRRALNFSLTPIYNLNNYFQLGGQFLVKSPNAEFYLGSDQLLKNYYVAKGFLTSDARIGKGNTAASVYMGFGLKFGRVRERQQNASYIPVQDKDLQDGLLKRIYKRLFVKKKLGREQE